MPKRKTTDDTIVSIKAELALGLKSKAQIARDHGVSRGLVFDIWKGTTHKNIPTPELISVPVGMKGSTTKIPMKPGKPLDPTDERVLDLESKVLLLTEERNKLRRVSKVNSKANGLVNAVTDELTKRIVAMAPLPRQRKVRKKDTRIKEHLVVHLSDGHHAEIVLPEQCGGLEEYNFHISCRRAENYVQTIIDWTQSALSDSYDFTDLTILAYGDHTSGEIHDAVRQSTFGNEFKNSLAIGQLHALMIRDLAPYFETINVVYLSGNHGRRTPKKDHNNPQNNFDYLIGKVADLHCGDLENVHFVHPNAFAVNINIEGHVFNVSHGDDVRGTGGIPFYGATRRKNTLLALAALQGDPPINYFVHGHHHIAGTLADLGGEILFNGAWCGTNPYSYNSFSGYREPVQLIHGVNSKYGVTWRLNVKLRSTDDVKGPKRYKVVV